MAGGIFISYRRDDSRHAAGRLVDRLGQTFRHDQLFMDVDTIEPGLDFRNVVKQKVGACEVMLAIIGPQWLEARDEAGRRRLEDPRDFVRMEIESALARDIRVVPVLVDGAALPREENLPSTLRPLVHRNAVRIDHERFGADAAALTTSLTKVVSPGRQGWLGGSRPAANAGLAAERSERRGRAAGLLSDAPAARGGNPWPGLLVGILAGLPLGLMVAPILGLICQSLGLVRFPIPGNQAFNSGPMLFFVPALLAMTFLGTAARVTSSQSSMFRRTLASGALVTIGAQLMGWGAAGAAMHSRSSEAASLSIAIASAIGFLLVGMLVVLRRLR